MTDIVERLRAQANDWQGQGDDFYGPLFGEAADEIDRLRWALDEVRTELVQVYNRMILKKRETKP